MVMKLRAVLSILLVLGTGLAGCLSPSDEETLEGATVDDAPQTVGSPEGRGRIIAFEETNETEEGVGGVDHHHDYWQGRTRVVMFEREAMMDPFPDDNGRAYSTFRPPQGTFVYEATERVEFTISNPRRHVCEGLVTFGGHYYCTDYLGSLPAAPSIPDPNPPTGLTLRYKHAATVEWIEAGTLTWGEPLTIQITNPIQTDMPHATSSVWEFQVVSPHAQDTTLVFDAKAEMVRGEGDVPLWPGHPLFYDEERTSRVILQEAAAAACDTNGCALAQDDVDPITAERLISYGTRTLFIWVNVTDVQAPNPATAPTSWFLFHNNATGQENITNPFDQVNYGIEKRALFWALPVDDNGMDSPYADGSRWKFALGATYTSPDNPVIGQVSCYGGCAAWYAEYEITIIASSIQLSPEEYHLYCLDPQSYCGEEEDDDGRRQLVRRGA